MKKVKVCRSCGSVELLPFLSLGRLPKPHLLVAEQRSQSEERLPLDVAFCKRCGLTQFAGDTDPGLRPPHRTAPDPAAMQRLAAERLMGPVHLVLGLASGGGEGLAPFAQLGARVLGIEPLSELARAANARGIPTRAERFDRAYAQKLQQEGVRADLILADEAIARAADPGALLEDLLGLLKDQGVLVLQAPSLRLLLEGRRFDRLTHDQLNYFSVSSLHDLLRRHGLWMGRAEALPDGGVRYLASRVRGVEPSVGQQLELEQVLGLRGAAYYQEFASQVAALREALLAMLVELRARGRRIAACGAGPEGVLLLNFVGLGREVIDFVADPDPQAHGRLMPGVHVPVVAPAHLLDEQPDYLLVLDSAQAEAAADYEEFLEAGGKLIVPLPFPTIVNPLLRLASPEVTVG